MGIISRDSVGKLSQNFFPLCQNKKKGIFEYYNFTHAFSPVSAHMTASFNFNTIFNKLGVSFIQGRKGKGNGKCHIWDQSLYFN